MFALMLSLLYDALAWLEIDVSTVSEVTITWSIGRLFSRYRVKIGNYTYSVKISRN